MDSQFFCENPRCQFFIESDAKTALHYFDRNDGDREKEIKRLHVVQQTPGGPPRDFYFCENCANVLAMTFGKTKTQTQHVSEKQTTE